MNRREMDNACNDFVRAAHMALEAGFDLLQLNAAHGYLLASFLSPLTNLRCDEYGGVLEGRSRYLLEVFDAVRATWPEHKPLSVALTVTDCVKGGFEVEDAVTVARLLKAHGCDILEVQAGQTTIESEPAYERGFLTQFSERVRNEAQISTMVSGYLTTSNEVNTILAAGRADLCIMDIPLLPFSPADRR
jgi:anthraniloyl-CoA monooxygenase